MVPVCLLIFSAYVLRDDNTRVSALSSLYEKIHTQSVDNDLRELSETKVGDPKRFSDVHSGPTKGSDANECGTQILLFTLDSVIFSEKFIVLQIFRLKFSPLKIFNFPLEIYDTRLKFISGCVLVIKPKQLIKGHKFR